MKYTLLIFTAFCAGILAHFAVSPAPAPAPVIAPHGCEGEAEVSDLIARLKPLADKPDAAWYSNGISLTFTGTDVTLKLRTKNGNEYNGRASTLREAVSRISDPASDIRDALQGWTKPR